jgi:hypothetical protein
VLGAADGARFCAGYGISAEGNFEHGASVPHRFSAPEGTDFAALEPLRVRLLAAREARPRPAKDDKILAAWNGLALTALARGYQVLGEHRYLEAAQRLAGFLRSELWQDGTLLRTWRRGQAHTPGFLEDYAAVAAGLVDLYEAGFDPAWLRWAEQLGESLRTRFEDPDQGGLYGSAAGAGDLLFRQKPLYDGALPSGNTLATGALLRLGRHLQRPDFLASAAGALHSAAPLADQAPTALLAMLAVLGQAESEPVQIVISGPATDPATAELIQEASRTWLPNRILTLATADPGLPLHQGHDLDRPAATVCRDRVCAAPAHSRAELAARLG